MVEFFIIPLQLAFEVIVAVHFWFLRLSGGTLIFLLQSPHDLFGVFSQCSVDVIVVGRWGV